MFSILSEIADETENETEIQDVPQPEAAVNTEIPQEKIEETINNNQTENINETIISKETTEPEAITPSDKQDYSDDSIQELNVSFDNEKPIKSG